MQKSSLLIKKIINILELLGRPFYLALKFIIKGIKKTSKWMRKVKFHLIVWAVILVGMTAGVLIFKKEIIDELPDISQINTPPAMSSKIYDRNGELLYKFYEDENRTWIPIDKIPLSLIWATIAIEDKKFFDHHGLSIKGISQAVWYNINKSNDDNLRGGSTITQQLVKNIFLSNEKTFKRKIKELLLSISVEWNLDKYQILERYFNQIPYGGETYGVQEAANKYFGKNVWELNMNEAAFLAGLPAAPSSYSPYGENKEYAYARMRHVIDEMANVGFISKEKAEELKKNNPEIKESTKYIRSPHFVFYVKDELAKMGFDNFEKEGLSIYTTLDMGVQKEAEKIVADEVSKAKNLHITNGAVLVLDVKTGEILAMVGSKDYYAADIDGKYNVTTALRQPGSSIKPINYLVALKKGKTLLSTIDDSPVSYPISGQKPYTPQNYNGKYMGRVTLKTALASSLNIPSVKLLNENGVDSMIDQAEEMGITTWEDRSRFGLSLALGSGEVKMTELAGAYSIFANSGVKNEVVGILKIDDYLGKNIYLRRLENKRVVDEKYTFLINEALSSNEARTPIFGANSKLRIKDRTVAVKTGTTNSLKDNWCVGWTPNVLVATWVGNNDSSPMSWVASGVSGATPIWNRLMTELTMEAGEQKWSVPEGVEKMKVCGKEEYFIVGTESEVKCKSEVSPTPEGSDFNWQQWFEDANRWNR